MNKKAKLYFRKIYLKGVLAFSRIGAIADLFPFKKPPVLILSFARSGSSWVGSILATSRSAAYLVEPITQSFIQVGGKYGIVDINSDPSVYAQYKEISELVFRGIPPRNPIMGMKLRDFTITGRMKRHLLIKEVNPRAAGFFREQFNPLILLLIRHPAAVALSLSKIGWIMHEDTQLDTGDPNADKWQKFGYAYGSYMNEAFIALKDYTDCVVVQFEHLALEPLDQFAKLFETLELDPPHNYKDVIENFCFANIPVKSPHQIKRNSKQMVNKWKVELTKEELTSVRTGFLMSSFPFYREAKDWMPL
jgi:hypothetical protein